MSKLIYAISIITVIATMRIDNQAAILMFFLLWIVACIHGIYVDDKQEKRHKPPSNIKQFSAFVAKTNGEQVDFSGEDLNEEYQNLFNNKKRKTDSFIEMVYDEKNGTFKETTVKCHM